MWEGSALCAAAAAALERECVQHRILWQPPRDCFRDHRRHTGGCRRPARRRGMHRHSLTSPRRCAASAAVPSRPVGAGDGVRGGAAGWRGVGVRGLGSAGGDRAGCGGGLRAPRVLQSWPVSADESSDLLLKHLQVCQAGISGWLQPNRCAWHGVVCLDAAEYAWRTEGLSMMVSDHKCMTPMQCTAPT